MPYRLGQGIGNDTLVVDGIYHVYNRTIGGVSPFLHPKYSKLFLKLLQHYKIYSTSFSHYHRHIQNQVLDVVPVEIYSYCLMPNHYHLLVKQLIDGGLSKYIKRLSQSFTNLYNKETNRTGTLWQGPFKDKLVETDESFLQVKRYIDLNPSASVKLNIRRLEEYPWSSYLDAIGKRDSKICNHELLWGLMDPEAYAKFVNSKIDTDEYEKYFIDQAHPEHPEPGSGY